MLIRVSFSFVETILSILFSASSHQIVDKENLTEFSFTSEF